MTLIELLVSMAVTSMLLVALGGVFVNVSSRYQGWADRLNSASTGSALAVNLQADSHRYVVCSATNTLLSTLDLCPALPPGDPAGGRPAPVVRYQVSARAPYVISRQSPVGAPPAFMARSVDSTQPQFWADCFDAGNVVSGHIHVYHLRIDDGAGGHGTGADRENFMVYYSAPWTGACA
jgi:hypothetical protein